MLGERESADHLALIVGQSLQAQGLEGGVIVPEVPGSLCLHYRR